MFTRRLTLFRAFGIAVKVDLSWLILAFLIASSLAFGWFPVNAAGYSQTAYWLMGAAGAIGLFASILIHEFCHAVVGHAFKMKIEEITLFLFGGVAHLEDEPPSPKAELLMALAGPAASVVLAGVFWGVYQFTSQSSPLLYSLFAYLASVNLVVAIFNMLPGYPLDGGRVLRSILWGAKRDLRWATKIASGIGQFFGIGLIVLGVFSLLSGSAISGVWSILLGLLLASFARASYVQLLVKQSLHGKPAASFMNPAPLMVSADTPVSDLMTGTLYQADQTIVPVVKGEREFVGCVDLREVKEMPEGSWQNHQVSELVHDCSTDMRIDPESDAGEALSKMSKTGNRQLLVVKNNRLLGILSQNALIRYITWSEA